MGSAPVLGLHRICHNYAGGPMIVTVLLISMAGFGFGYEIILQEMGKIKMTLDLNGLRYNCTYESL